MRVIPLNRFPLSTGLRWRGGVSLIGLALLSGSATSLCAEAAAAALPPLPTPQLGSSIFRMLGALAIVFAVFLGGLWLLRNWQRLVAAKGRAPRLNVHEVKSLGHRHALYVVGYDQQRMLLSSSPTGVTMLTLLPPETDSVVKEESIVPEGRFLDSLQQAMARGA